MILPHHAQFMLSIVSQFEDLEARGFYSLEREDECRCDRST
jgi:hypothetical protein